MGYCKYCGKPAIVNLKYANLRLCRDHFISFYENRIRKMLQKYGITGPLLVAVSGGKDSMSLLAALKKISALQNIQIFAFHINLGIPNYSDKSMKMVKEFAKRIGVPLIIADLVEEIGYDLPQIAKVIDRPICSVCGIIKRWMINKIGYECGFDYVATGHNIDDTSTYLLKALMTQDLYSIVRGQWEILQPKKEMKLVGRIRPQFYLSEKENMLYASLNDIPVVEEPCPYSRGATIHKYKSAWSTLLDINPIAQINITKTIMKLRKMLSIEEPEIKQCLKCEFPTESKDGICSFCKIMEKISEKLGQ